MPPWNRVVQSSKLVFPLEKYWYYLRKKELVQGMTSISPKSFAMKLQLPTTSICGQPHISMVKFGETWDRTKSSVELHAKQLTIAQLWTLLKTIPQIVALQWDNAVIQCSRERDSFSNFLSIAPWGNTYHTWYHHNNVACQIALNN